jgi:hypothetical protein
MFNRAPAALWMVRGAQFFLIYSYCLVLGIIFSAVSTACFHAVYHYVMQNIMVVLFTLAVLSIVDFVWALVVIREWGRLGNKVWACGGRMCLHCGYPLPGDVDTGMCSECGEQFDMEENRRLWRITVSKQAGTNHTCMPSSRDGT